MLGNTFIFISLVISFCCTFAEISSPPKITLSHGGILVGGYMNSVSGKGIHGYRGIPYAEPPVGQLRFRAPIPVQPWSGEKLVNKDAEMCPQNNPYLRNYTIVGNEDCLYLNVYVPKERTQDELLSVMVYIHGGGWISGGGISQLYGPDRLLDNDNIILVTGNYRLGVLGFLSTLTSDCPGNNGLKDQLQILKWVRTNIAAFGGNPNDVTLFGESAGGGSVGHHLISPLSKGLFHKAILQSGTNFNCWALAEPPVTLANAAKIGKLLNCSTVENNWKNIIECLRTKSSYEIVSPIQEFFEFDIDPVIPFQPVIEPDTPESFIVKAPEDIAIPHSNHIPIMIGVTTDEGAMKSGPLINLMDEKFKEEFNKAIPILLFYHHRPKDIRNKITAKIDEFYFNGIHDWSKQNHQNLTNVITDSWFIEGMDRHLLHRFNYSNLTNTGPTYVYLYDHRGSMHQSSLFHSGPEYFGVCHTDELPYLFPFNKNVNGSSSIEDKNDEKMKWAMPFMWVNFAKTGNPTPPGSEIDSWKPATKFPLNYVHIGSQKSEDWAVLRNEIGFVEDRVQFWRSLKEDLKIKNYN